MYTYGWPGDKCVVHGNSLCVWYQAGRPTGVGDNVYLPDSVAATGVKISSDGVFLCDIGTALYLYIGSQVKHEYLAGVRAFLISAFCSPTIWYRRERCVWKQA